MRSTQRLITVFCAVNIEIRDTITYKYDITHYFDDEIYVASSLTEPTRNQQIYTFLLQELIYAHGIFLYICNKIPEIKQTEV